MRKQEKRMVSFAPFGFVYGNLSEKLRKQSPQYYRPYAYVAGMWEWRNHYGRQDKPILEVIYATGSNLSGFDDDRRFLSTILISVGLQTPSVLARKDLTFPDWFIEKSIHKCGPQCRPGVCSTKENVTRRQRALTDHLCTWLQSTGGQEFLVSTKEGLRLLYARHYGDRGQIMGK